MTRVFVAGGAGVVGEGVVRAWLRQGALVVTATRSAERGEALKTRSSGLGGRLVVLDGPSSDPDLLERALVEYGPFEHAVASMGGVGWRIASLERIEDDMFRQVVEDGITGHWLVARTLIPSLPAHGSYVFINGGAALEIIPGTGPLSLVARAQLALADIFRTEIPRGPRITSLVINTPIATPSRGEGFPSTWLSQEDAGTAALNFAIGGSSQAEIVLDHRGDIDHV